jgi:hypothetical protein
MGLLLRASDTFYAFRFLRLLTTPWENTGAFKAGIVDETGKVIKKPSTSAEKGVYTIFHRLVFNIKRTLNKIPLGKTKIASYLTALYLLKESHIATEDQIQSFFEDQFGYTLCKDILCEHQNTKLQPGTYALVHNLALPKSGEMLALKGSKIVVSEQSALNPCGDIFGVAVFEAHHIQTGQTLYITPGDISLNESTVETKDEDVTTADVAIPALPLKLKRKTGNQSDDNSDWKTFTLPSDIFRRFETGRNKFERWSKYLDLNDENQRELYEYAKSKGPKKSIMLQCSTTGSLRGLRRRASNE